MTRTSRGGAGRRAPRAFTAARRCRRARAAPWRRAPRTRRSGRCSPPAPRRRRRCGCLRRGAASEPTPPEAITGTATASATARVSARSKPRLGAVAVHARQQDLAGAERGDAARPLDGVEAGVPAAAVGVDVPARRAAGAPLGVDRDDDALRAVLRRRLADDLGRRDRRRVEAHLVGAGVEEPAHVGDGAHAAADGERDEHLRRDRLDDVQDQVALVAGRGDVEEGELVGALLVVARGDLDRIAGVAQLDEVDALDDAAGGDVEAGNDSFGEHGGDAAGRCAVTARRESASIRRSRARRRAPARRRSRARRCRSRGRR